MKHPLKSFRFCPKCGSQQFVEHDMKSKKCLSCGFTYYLNPSSATAAFIVNSKNEVLVAKRAIDPAKGTYDLPGGFVDLYETAEDAIIREIKEETGLQVTYPEYLFSLPNIYLYSEFEVHTVDQFFQINLSEDTIPVSPADDVSELLFISKKDLQPQLFGLDSIRKGVKLWLDQ